MSEQRSPIDRLLNTDTPHRPASAEEVAERIAAARPESGTSPPGTAQESAEESRSSAAERRDRPPVREVDEAVPPAEPPAAGGEAAQGGTPRRQSDLAEQQLARILGQAESLVNALSGSLSSGQGGVESTDESGAVTVEVEGGKRVTRISVAADWQRRVAAEMLGAAVMQAIMSAQLGSLNDFLGGVVDKAAAPTPPPRPRTPPPVASTEADWTSLGRMFETVNRALDDLLVNPSAAPGPRFSDEDLGRTVGRSANRRVEVVFVAGGPAEVNVDASWAARTGRQQLAESLLQAFQEAQDQEAQNRETSGREAQGRQVGGTGAPSGIFGDLQEILRSFGVRPGPEQDKDQGDQ